MFFPHPSIGAIGVLGVVADIVQIYIFVLIARALLSWFPVRPGTPMATVIRVLSSLTEPVVRPVRRAIPPIRTGGVGIDIAFIVVVVGLEILVGILHTL